VGGGAHSGTRIIWISSLTERPSRTGQLDREEEEANCSSVSACRPSTHPSCPACSSWCLSNRDPYSSFSTMMEISAGRNEERRIHDFAWRAALDFYLFIYFCFIYRGQSMFLFSRYIRYRVGRLGLEKTGGSRQRIRLVLSETRELSACVFLYVICALLIRLDDG